MPTTVGPAAGDFLRLSAQRHPDRACFVLGNGRQWTFAEVNSRVNRLADAFAAHGIGRGDRVALFAVNGIGYAEVILACLKLGCTYVPLNNRLAAEETATLLQSADPVALFTDERYIEHLAPLLSHAPNLRLTALFGGEYDSFIPYERLVAEGRDVEPDVRVGDDEIVGLAFTSGTTGKPKGVLQSQRMIKNLVTAITLDYEIQPDEFRYSSSPMFHIGGQSPVLMHVWRGFPTLILPQFDVDEVLWWLQHGELTGCFLVPTMISGLLAHPAVEQSDYPELRSIIYGAAPMPPTVLRRALEVFRCDFVNAFGAGTETGLQTVLGSADHRRAAAGAEHLLGSIGKPAYGVDLRLLDSEGNDVPRGSVGEIVTLNAQTMSGYLDRPEETAQALQDGWFRAGDLAYMDDDGYLYLAGRRNDMIIRGAENIYPIEIEDVLCRHEDIDQAAVIGAPDEHWGEVVVAFIVPRRGRDVDTRSIRTHCRQYLAAYKVPAELITIAELPVNAGGKVVRRELRRRVCSNEHHPPRQDRADGRKDHLPAHP
ncbi:class I adenylate-forming enzyme family protein [Rhodococcus sp. T7]|uniref:class I adenylate-forming enzyme family protein n=1 Tax=Rhodococcus sp. T7 TaxID=627444 RepID=UPI0013580B2C|nr:AMP-binding protein [Rhodococcus sp. T7]KAF0957008.1 Long-chain-fatty-acid--CoA ligase FadD13 [Rhodococcus sp. T7]KAF0958713.1 Long-chain-fatty-acid--CoA ligase FadD13 [Rhodococcus sp. T7]